MVTSKIANLSEADLDYLDRLLQKEFSRQTNKATQWRSKNKYPDPSDNTKKISRLMDAVRSQKKLLTMVKW